MLKTEQSDSST